MPALKGPNCSTPGGSMAIEGTRPVGAGTKTVPLPTATQFEPLRGSLTWRIMAKLRTKRSGQGTTNYRQLTTD
jgi:hypothetical protein